MVTTYVPGTGRLVPADALRDGTRNQSVRLPPVNRPELADLLAAVSLEAIDRFLRHCQAEANRHSCSMGEIKNGEQESEFKRGQACAYGEMMDAVTSRGASFGLSPEAQAGFLEYLRNESGGEIARSTSPEDGTYLAEYHEKGMERAYRHVTYQVGNHYTGRLGPEGMKSTVRHSGTEDTAPHRSIRDLF
jgi:hypothetical protein